MLAQLTKIPVIAEFSKSRIKKAQRVELFEYVNEVPFGIPKLVREAIINQ
jgi:hypothetical protein